MPNAFAGGSTSLSPTVARPLPANEFESGAGDRQAGKMRAVFRMRRRHAESRFEGFGIGKDDVASWRPEDHAAAPCFGYTGHANDGAEMVGKSKRALRPKSRRLALRRAVLACV